ncbi:MAG: right-handed parallel beta-helix repeat-containing protein [Candidatus Hodarchaeales archaeon]|jgi:parallel beta-helix repeat protein
MIIISGNIGLGSTNNQYDYTLIIDSFTSIPRDEIITWNNEVVLVQNEIFIQGTLIIDNSIIIFESLTDVFPIRLNVFFKGEIIIRDSTLMKSSNSMNYHFMSYVESSVTITNSFISDMGTTSYGSYSGLSTIDSNVHIDNCTFYNNINGITGIGNLNTTIMNSKFISNTNGILWDDAGNITIKNNVFSNNSNGININEGQGISILNNEFSTNTFNSLSTSRINDLNIINNSFQESYFGVISESNSNILVKDNTFSITDTGLIINNSIKASLDNNNFNRSFYHKQKRNNGNFDTAIIIQDTYMTNITNNIIFQTNFGIRIINNQVMEITDNKFIEIFSSALEIKNNLNGSLKFNYFKNIGSVLNLSQSNSVSLFITLNDFLNITSLYEFSLNSTSLNDLKDTPLYENIAPNMSIYAIYNYYDDYIGIDINFDGIGDMEYGIDQSPLYYPSEYYEQDGENIELQTLYISPLHAKKRDNIWIKGLIPIVIYYFSFLMILIGVGILYTKKRVK